MNINEHLKTRHLNLDLHRPMVDVDSCVATFLLYNLSGQIVGYQQYNPLGDKKIFNSKEDGRYYTYRNKNNATISLWGVESLDISDGPIFLSEGVFDSCRFTKRGVSGLASLSNDPPLDYKNWFMILPRPVIVICDNDIAGKKLSKFGDYFEVTQNNKDLGDSPEDYITYLIDKYCAS